MENISVKLPQLLHAKVSEEARLRSVSKSTIVREALERSLDERGKKSKDISCAVLATGLIGSVRSGRRDLATIKSL